MNNQAVKKVPLRRCALTGEQHPKKEMFRVVRTPERNIEIDETGKVRGHGVYLIKDKDVILKAKAKHSLDRELETHVEDAIYDALIERL